MSEPSILIGETQIWKNHWGKARCVEMMLGATLEELAGAKYAVIPSDLSYTVTIKGSATGTYTLLIQRSYNGKTQDLLRTKSIRVTPSHTATFSKTEGTFSPLSIDRDGDGVVDTHKKWKKVKRTREKEQREHHDHKEEKQERKKKRKEEHDE